MTASAPPDVRASAADGDRAALGVQVWQVDLDAAQEVVDDAASALSVTGLAAADRGAPAVRRRRIMLRAALRSVLGAALGCTPAEVPLTRGALGRPTAPGGWDVSCSRAGDVGLVAVARGLAVGIDVGLHRPPATVSTSWATAREHTHSWVLSRVRVPVGLAASIACSVPVLPPGARVVPRPLRTTWSTP